MTDDPAGRTDRSETRFQRGLHEEDSGRAEAAPLSDGDSTIGDEPSESGHGSEELEDVTEDGSRGDGTLGDGEYSDAYDVLAAGRPGGPASETVPGAVDPERATPRDAPLTGEEDDMGDATGRGPMAGDQPGDEPLPDELAADAMGRPLEGAMNDDDQGMENAGRNLGA